MSDAPSGRSTRRGPSGDDERQPRDFWLMADALPALVWTADADGHIVAASRDLFEYVGAPGPTMPGGWSGSIHPDDLDHVVASWRAAAASGEAYSAEMRLRRADGEYRWYLVTSNPVLDDAGAVVSWSGTGIDVHDRRVSEERARRDAERLRESEERFRLVSQATSDVVFDMNLVRDEVWYSDGLSSLVGIEFDGVVSADVARRGVHPDDAERWQAGIDAAVEGRADSWYDEFRLLRVDGTDVWVAGHGSAVVADDGTPLRFVGTLVDLTERRRLEQRLHQAERLEAIGQLTGGIAHDFNNLLTVVLGSADVLTELLADPGEIDRDEATDLVRTARIAAERGADLTQRLLAFARRQPLEPVATDVGVLLGGLHGFLRRSLGDDVEVAPIDCTTEWSAFVDAAQLESAVLNLCINARDAMSSGGSLTIGIHEVVLDADDLADAEELVPGEYVVVAVSDTGAGMAPSTAARAFDPFFTTKETGEGHGLGLSMVYGFVKQSGGHVRLYSEVGIGTIVRLYLPRAQAAPSNDASSPPEAVAAGGTERILVAEDDPMVRALAVRHLERLGYRVVAVEDGPSALDVLRSDDSFDLLFTDVVMPGGMYGPELAELARAIQPDLPVLFTSGYTENAIVHRGRLDPGVELLSKPYRFHELAQRVRAVLDAR